MAKKKKKQSEHQKQKLAQAQHKAEYLRKFRIIINTIVGNDIFSQIDKKILDEYYARRCLAFNLQISGGHNIPNDLFKTIKAQLNHLLFMQRFKLTEYGPEISIGDFYTLGIDIKRFAGNVADGSLETSPLFIPALIQYDNDGNCIKEANALLYATLGLLGFYFSELGNNLYWLRYQFVISGGNALNSVLLYKANPETITFNIDDKPRPAVELCLGYPYEGIKKASLRPSELGIKNGNNDDAMKVYIQSHALNRLKERMDNVPIGMVHFNMFESFRKPKVCRGKNDIILLELDFMQVKTGYFVLDIINNKILVRTFLFLTNSGTPEGQLLEQNTGLKKMDRKFLMIDKLSTFKNEDLGNNAEIRKIFEDAGCKSLIEMSKTLENVGSANSDKPIAEQILKYLKTNIPDDIDYGKV